ncbi:Microsomal triglyceride transfer protein large subunit [Halotydeus destructor]|nr:Microsomal triglyceride transfer protein large subunit [Halotydeus destructor]
MGSRDQMPSDSPSLSSGKSISGSQQQGLPPPPPPPPPGAPGAYRAPTYRQTQDANPQMSLQEQQYANLPSKLMTAMNKDKKPFSYTLGAVGEKGILDLSQIKSPRMRKRLMANLKGNEEAENTILTDQHNLMPDIVNSSKDPVGFGYTSHFSVQNVWEDSDNFILKLTLTGPASGGHFTTRSGEERRGPGPTIYHKANELAPEDSYPFYAHVVDTDDHQEIKAFYVHNRETNTRSNLKKAIVFLTRTKPSARDKNVDWSKTGNEIKKRFSFSNVEEDSSVLTPNVEDDWASETTLGRDHVLVVSSKGWQNVTLRSRLYQEAHSKLYISYNLKLVNEEESSEKSHLKGAIDLKKAIDLIGEDFIEEPPTLVREKQVCHECRTLSGLTKDYSDFMEEDNAATVKATIAFLKVLERIRSGGPGTSKDDILLVLKELREAKKTDVLASMLDALAGARTEQSIEAAFEFLSLPLNDDLDQCERFLSSLAASVVTSSKQQSSDSSQRFILDELHHVAKKQKWTSHKLKLSTLIALASALKATNLASAQIDEDLNRAVIGTITTELTSCKETECMITCLHALGNVGYLKMTVDILEKYALNFKSRRESVAAMKAIRDSLEDARARHLLDAQLSHRLRQMAHKVAHEPKQETTARIIASEIVGIHLVDEHLSMHLIESLQSFENNEMVTSMWKRALKDVLPKSKVPANINNWLSESTLLNGSSASFTRPMGGTNTAKATFGVALELGKGKLLKESAFDVGITSGKKHESILSVGLFARGLGSFTSGGEEDGDDEAAMAGMSLKVLGMQMRPFVFFTGTGELMGHVWSGTGSEPMSAYRANLLLIDTDEGYPLINGFMAEHKLKGVVSLDLTGEASVSLWNRNSHAVVKTKVALLVEGSQTVLTSDVTTMAAQQFTFGGATMVDTVTDTDFYNTPFKMCVQTMQPEFIVRHHARKFEQVDSDKVHRRVHKRSYTIPAKSFALHRDNNEMCSAMHSS